MSFDLLPVQVLQVYLLIIINSFCITKKSIISDENFTRQQWYGV